MLEQAETLRQPLGLLRSDGRCRQDSALRPACPHFARALSLWALVSGHWSAWQAARVEVNQAEEMRAHEQEDLAGDIVQRVIADTDVNPA